MDVLLKYQRADGFIRGMFQSIVEGMLDGQIVPDDPDYGYLRVDTDVRPEHLQRGYYVQAGALVAKAVLTLTAMPNPFVADGVAECQVTVTPFVACILVVDGTDYALTETDQVVELTSDTPHRFRVELAQVAAYQAEAISVEAT